MVPTMAAGELPSRRALLLREYDNAWVQSRHLETTRSQYVGFFLTFLAAVVALVGSRSADAYHDPRTAVELSLVVAGMSAVTWFVSVSTRRWGVVITHYDDVILGVRQRVLTSGDRALVQIGLRNEIGIQQAAELTLLLTHLALLSAAAVVCGRVATLDPRALYLATTSAALALVALSTLTGANWRVLYKLRPPGRNGSGPDA